MTGRAAGSAAPPGPPRVSRRGLLAGAGALLAGVAAGCAAAGPLPTASPRAPGDDLPARLDAAVTGTMRQLGIPGAIVGLSVPGIVEYSQVFGVADDVSGRPMSLAEHVRIGSVTKTFTGTAVLRLVEDRLLALSDPIARFVGGLPSGDRITLRMLGDMRSGLYSYEQDPAFVAAMLAELPQGPDAGAVTPAQLVDVSAARPLAFPPGSRFEYVDVNAVLLGMVVERVTGRPLGDYLREHVFAPLRLSESVYPASGALPEPYAHGYTRGAGGAVTDASLWNPAWAGAAGAIVSTFADMKTWALALGKGTLLDPQTQSVRLGRVPESGPAAAYRFAIFESGGWWGHNGSIPGYTSVVMSIPQRSATLVVLANTDVPPVHAAGALAAAVTRLATPDHVYAQLDGARRATPSPTPGR
ncbi:serine hydrolase [Catellatospora sp. IY07-71]|uniref:serine hydrolase domain-containing protein n=1 Tax=Catellatospora sp. IY07-71 TaxID=2728827 RepID=UPI001BB3A324|nr:serine hydrolase domain-containing protein [Catellatospora sp. IY07-71]BCJ78114.1 serine hydrolase [Catellatospora sp. IY07-71]